MDVGSINQTSQVKSVKNVTDKEDQLTGIVISSSTSKLTDVNGEEYEPGTLSNYSKGQISKAIDDANRFLVGKNTKFSYSVHEGTGRTVVKLVDIETEEVVREIPPQKFLDAIANLWEMAGILVDKMG
ncbi:flagellar protein FlaG [Vagococcus sp. BWB3-3]|uniref:Flagellar protein FlaG n=1 Tax=Vagococcus allomyrinae TaxID=2794353 RepID=A0A940PEG0_9ENTE|nr:flagellar protein FlaG [Vagococcus allomyrinae]MBP1042006.1 flagellar protein FlaG [Vagococcus allomyrinae]